MTQTESFAGTEFPFYPPQTGERERELLGQVLESNYLNDGDVTRRFEAMIAEAVEVRHCVAVTSGTTAITLALMAAGLEPGDEVIVPDLTFIATANAARLAGANVRLVDVELRTFGIDPERLEEVVGPHTKAVVTVDVNGRGPRYEEISRICQAHGLSLICDAAEGLGSRYAGRAIGSYGRAACFSFSANKRICTGQGGAVVTDDVELAARVRELKDQGRRVQGSGGDDDHPVLGFNFKLTNLQAAVGVAQMERFAERIEQARSLRRWYQRELADCPGIRIPDEGDNGTVLQWFDMLVENRAGLSGALRRSGIGHRAFWRPLHKQEPYKDDAHRYPVAEEICAKGMWLPSGVAMTESDVGAVAGGVRAALGG